MARSPGTMAIMESVGQCVVVAGWTGTWDDGQTHADQNICNGSSHRLPRTPNAQGSTNMQTNRLDISMHLMRMPSDERVYRGGMFV